jgi:hypothetical protein
MMKLKYAIPLLLAGAFGLMLLNTAVLGVAASWAMLFTKHEYGYWNIVIIRTVAMAAAFVVGSMALPLGYVADRWTRLGGVLLAVLGIAVVVNPWNGQAISILKTCLPEYAAYVVSCSLFWGMGAIIRRHRGIPNTVRVQPSPAPSEPAPARLPQRIKADVARRAQARSAQLIAGPVAVTRCLAALGGGRHLVPSPVSAPLGQGDKK